MYTFLALGDSYTVGEAVPVYESFPYQTVQLLREQNTHFHAPDIVAKTGWTSGELAEHIKRWHFSLQYDFVTLLIGVNDQYRGLSTGNYQIVFEELLQFAIKKADHHPENIFVLSIPDWGQTPFGLSKDPARIAEEIDSFNAINRSIALHHKVNYVDITPSTRRASKRPEYVAVDGLHPSGMEYAAWARQLFEGINARLKR